MPTMYNPADLRNQGFGLNYSRGFQSRGPAGFGSTGRIEALQGAQDYIGSAQRLRGQKDLLGIEQGGANYRAQLAADAARYPAQLQQERFNQVFPLLSGLLGGYNFDRVGGQSGPSPEITVGPVWNQQQVQQQVNAARATNDAVTANQTRATEQEVAGRGFGSNSPLLAALRSGQQMAGMRTNAESERNIRLGAAETNAQQLLKTQQAREGQFATRMDEDIRRRQAALQGYSALLGTLGGLV